MIYNIVLLSGVQQSDSAIHIHISVLFYILFSYRLSQNIEFPGLYSRSLLVIYLVYSSVFDSNHRVCFGGRNISQKIGALFLEEGKCPGRSNSLWSSYSTWLQVPLLGSSHFICPSENSVRSVEHL